MPEIVVRARTELASDGSHEHVVLFGYHSEHIKTEPITVDVDRVISRMAAGDEFWITTPEGRAEVIPGKCGVCGHEPYLRTSADAEDSERLLALPEG